jgi:hypothetical protein
MEARNNKHFAVNPVGAIADGVLPSESVALAEQCPDAQLKVASAGVGLLRRTA